MHRRRRSRAEFGLVFVVLGFLSVVAIIILLRKRKLVALLIINCVVAVCVLFLFLAVAWVGL